MIQIIPTLFSTTEEEYQKRLSKLNSCELLQGGWVQLDFMDNKFVPNLSIGLDVVKKYPLEYQKEAQLMVIDPNQWIDRLVDFGVDRIIFPVEIDKNILELINKIKQNKIEVGLSLNPETEVEKLDPYLDLLDAVLCMGVKPGEEGQQFNTNTYQKIADIKQRNPGIKVGVDGGVNDKNAKDLADAGADYLAIGSFLFNGNISENLEILWEVINEQQES